MRSLITARLMYVCLEPVGSWDYGTVSKSLEGLYLGNIEEPTSQPRTEHRRLASTYAYCQNCIGIACLGSLISLRRGECDWKCFATELAATTELIVNIRRNDEDS